MNLLWNQKRQEWLQSNPASILIKTIYIYTDMKNINFFAINSETDLFLNETCTICKTILTDEWNKLIT